MNAPLGNEKLLDSLGVDQHRVAMREPEGKIQAVRFQGVEMLQKKKKKKLDEDTCTQQTIAGPLTAHNAKIPQGVGFSPTTVPKLSTG